MAEEAKPSVVTLEMIRAWAAHFEIDLEDGSQYPGIIGSLLDLEAGRGQYEPWMTEEAHGTTFAPLALARKEAEDAARDAGEKKA